MCLDGYCLPRRFCRKGMNKITLQFLGLKKHIIPKIGPLNYIDVESTRNFM
jgi:hypothetical protein